MSLLDNFTSAVPIEYTLKDDQISPNKLWKCVYASYGRVCVTNISTPTNGRTGKCLSMKPKAVQDTASCLVLSQEKFKDFDMTFYMRTVAFNRLKPNSWETAWVMFRYTDDKLPSGEEDLHHHYYMYIGTNGQVEIGKKDYELYNGGLITPDGIKVPGDQEHQQYLFTDAKVKFAEKKWFKVRVICKDRNIKLYIDDKLIADITDDGKIGMDEATGKRPLGYMASEKMLSGKVGFYCEDSAVEFGDIEVKSI